MTQAYRTCSSNHCGFIAFTCKLLQTEKVQQRLSNKVNETAPLSVRDLESFKNKAVLSFLTDNLRRTKYIYHLIFMHV